MQGLPVRGHGPCPGSVPLTQRPPEHSQGWGGRQGRAWPSYLHPTNVNGQDSGEEQHLKEEVRHQAHDSKETELLGSEQTRGYHDLMAPHPRAAVPGLQAPASVSAEWW